MAAASAQRRTTRKPATTAPARRRGKQALVDDAEGITPLVLTSTPDTEREPEERVVLFSIDGVDYDVPKVIPPALGLRVIRTARWRSEDQAAVELLIEVIGDEAFEALTSFRDLKSEHIAHVFGAVRKLAMGAVEAPKATSRRG
jgi:hypothetical protein